MRSRAGEMSAAGFAIVLLVCMFAFAWFGVDEIAGTPAARGGVVRTEDAWQAFSVVRWIMLATILAAVAGAVVPSVRKRVSPRRRGVIVTGVGSLTAALLAVRVLIDLPSAGRVPDQKLGALLGLMSALGIALGGWEAMRYAGAEGRSSPARGPRRGVAETPPAG